MSDENLRIGKGHLIASLLGAIGGGLFVYGISKWLPEQQEKIAKRQAEIIEERIARRMGMKYEKDSEEYSIKSYLETITSKLEEVERLLREYRGA